MSSHKLPNVPCVVKSPLVENNGLMALYCQLIPPTLKSSFDPYLSVAFFFFVFFLYLGFTCQLYFILHMNDSFCFLCIHIFVFIFTSFYKKFTHFIKAIWNLFLTEHRQLHVFNPFILNASKDKKCRANSCETQLGGILQIDNMSLVIALWMQPQSVIHFFNIHMAPNLLF